MPAINFSRQFEALVEVYEKRQTIRKVRKQPIVPGDMLQLYTGQRTAKCRLLLRELCLGVTPIRLFIDRALPQIELAGNLLTIEESKSLALKDGFGCGADMFLWFDDKYTLPFEGVLILW